MPKLKPMLLSLSLLLATISLRATAGADEQSPTTSPSSKPSQANTGPHGILRESADINCTQPDAIIENVNVTGTISIRAANVTIRNFRVDADNNEYCIRVYKDASVTLEDGELTNARESGIYGNDWTARRLNIHHMIADGTKGGGHNTLEDSWIHHLGLGPKAHADGLQIDNGSDIIVRHNNFDLPWRLVEGDQIFRTNSCFFIDAYKAPGGKHGEIDGVLIEDNWLNGGNYIVFGGVQSNTKVLNNKIGHAEQYGLLHGTVAEWAGNVWEGTSIVVAGNVKIK